MLSTMLHVWLVLWRWLRALRSPARHTREEQRWLRRHAAVALATVAILALEGWLLGSVLVGPGARTAVVLVALATVLGPLLALLATLLALRLMRPAAPQTVRD